LFCEPRQHGKGQGAGTIDDDNSGRQIATSREEPLLLLFLRVMREAVSNNQGPMMHAQLYPMAGKDQRATILPGYFPAAFRFATLQH
jgi:hypothetical protein